jgi:hypothetical protein
MKVARSHHIARPRMLGAISRSMAGKEIQTHISFELRAHRSQWSLPFEVARGASIVRGWDISSLQERDTGDRDRTQITGCSGEHHGVCDYSEAEKEAIEVGRWRSLDHSSSTQLRKLGVPEGPSQGHWISRCP